MADDLDTIIEEGGETSPAAPSQPKLTNDSLEAIIGESEVQKDDSDMASFWSRVGSPSVNKAAIEFLGFPFEALAYMKVVPELAVDQVYRFIRGAESIPPYEMGPVSKALTSVTPLLKKGFRAIGTDIDPKPANVWEQLGGRVIEETTGAALAAVPVLSAGQKLAQTLAPGQIAQSKTISEVLKTAAQKPGSFTTMEITMGAGAGAAAEVARQGVEGAGGGQTAQTAADFAGRLLGGASVNRLVGTPQLAGSFVKEVISPFTGKGRENRAVEALKMVSQDTGRALQALSQGRRPTGMTAAQLTGDPGLLGLQRVLASRDNQLEADLAQRRAEFNQFAGDEIGNAVSGDISPMEFTDALQSRRAVIQAGLRERTERAVANADMHLRAQDTGMTVEESSRLFRDSLDIALSDARTIESSMWSRIIKNRFVGMGPVRSKFAELKKGLTKSQQADPTTKREMARLENLIFKTLNGAENVNELMGSGGLRSQLLEKKRSFASGDTPNSSMAHITGQMAESVLDALMQAAKTSETGAVNALRITEARDYSRTLNDIFTRGVVGRVLGFEKTGGEKIQPVQTLRKLMTSKELGGEGAEQITSMASRLGITTGDLELATRRGLQNLFLESATNPDGSVNLKAMQRFQKVHEPALKRFPDLQKELGNASDAQDFAETMVKSEKRLLGQIEKSRAGLFLGFDDPVTALKHAMADEKRFDSNIKSLVRMAEKDDTGLAKRGLQSAFIDVVQQGFAGGKTDVAGEAILSAKRANDFLKRNRNAMNKILDHGQRSRLIRVVHDLNREQRAGLRSISQNEVFQTERLNLLSESVGRIVGARLGAKFSSTPLIGAMVGSKIVRRIMEKVTIAQIDDLLVESVLDPDVLQTLLMKVTPKTEPVVGARLRGHLARLGYEDEETPEGNPQPQPR